MVMIVVIVVVIVYTAFLGVARMLESRDWDGDKAVQHHILR